MKVLAFPRDDATPYQRLLYGEMQDLDVQVRYACELTPSHTVNLLLMPLELAVRRIARVRFVHLHWVFAFAFPGTHRFPALRYLAQAWFVICLGAVRMLRMRLIWTAHNVLPHAPVFANDVAARRRLVAASDLVIAHSQAALDDLIALDAVPRAHAIIPHGPLLPGVPSASLRVPGTNEESRRMLFFGRVQTYKGVDDLLQAFLAMHKDMCAYLTVAGECNDPELRRRLERLAQGCHRITLLLEHVPEEEVTRLLAAADFVVLPFRRVTTSGSATLALSHGRPLVVPDLAALRELPGTAVIRYDGTVPGLTKALTQVVGADKATLASMSDAARAYACATTWHEIAVRTASEMTALLDGARERKSRRRALAASLPRYPCA